MKLISSLFFSFVIFCSLYAQEQHTEAHKVTISRKNFYFETKFDFNANAGYLGHVIRDHISLVRNYTAYNKLGKIISSAYARWGAYSPASTSIDVYDENEVILGVIDATLLFTYSPAQYYFYDSEGIAIGIADLDLNKTSFTITDPSNSNHVIALLYRNIRNDTIDTWEMEIIDSGFIDLRLLMTFGAFVVDTQEKFLEDK